MRQSPDTVRAIVTGAASGPGSAVAEPVVAGIVSGQRVVGRELLLSAIRLDGALRMPSKSGPPS